MLKFSPNPLRRQAPSQVKRKSLDFNSIAQAALRAAPAILVRWLPDGTISGQEYTARNPLRADEHPGSFRVTLITGKWADFATGDKGGDLIALGAYLFSISQIEAARRLAGMLGVSNDR